MSETFFYFILFLIILLSFRMIRKVEWEFHDAARRGDISILTRLIQENGQQIINSRDVVRFYDYLYFIKMRW